MSHTNHLELLDRHLIAAGRSEATRAAYRSQLRAYLRHRGGRPVTLASMQAHVDARARVHPASADQAVSALQALAQAMGWGAVQLARPQDLPRDAPLSPAQLGRVLDAVHDDVEEAIVRLFVELGATVEQVRRLRRAQVGACRLVLPGAGQAAAVLSPRLGEVLGWLCLAQGPDSLVLRTPAGRAFSERLITGIVAMVGARAGLPHLTVDSLRRASVAAPRKRRGSDHPHGERHLAVAEVADERRLRLLPVEREDCPVPPLHPRAATAALHGAVVEG